VCNVLQTDGVPDLEILMTENCFPGLNVGSRALALADPYCHIAWNSVGLLVRER